VRGVKGCKRILERLYVRSSCICNMHSRAHHAKGRLCRMRVGAPPPAALAYERAPPPNTRALPLTRYRLAI